MGLNVGIIGYGGFGRFLHRAWASVEGVEVTAVADLSLTGVPDGIRTYGSGYALLEGNDVDLVSIATPPSSHAEIAIAALEHGVHVLVDKPIATTMSDAQSILNARDRSGCVASVNFMLRFNPIISTIHAWCRTGVFGLLQRVVVENYAQDETLGPDHWFWDETASGGILVEHGVHFFDIVNGCTQARVSRVDHRSWPRHPDMTDRMFALVEYDDGLVASHYHAFNRIDEFERTSIRFVFDAAQVEIEGWIPMQGRILAVTNDGGLNALTDLPNLNIIRERHVNASRSTALATGTRDQVPVDTIVSADFALDGSKEDAYQAALGMMMADVVNAANDPDHILRVSLEDGVSALALACSPSPSALGGTGLIDRPE